MPRVYKKKGSKNKWSDEQLHEAVQKVKSHELSLRAAALTYGIPKSTLSDHVKGVSSKRYGGCSTVLTREEEQYKLESMAENVGKPVFPPLIKKLWDCSFKPSHLVAGFRSCGLLPLDKAAVRGKLATSIPFREPSSDTSSTTCSLSGSNASSVASSVASSNGTLELQATGTLLIKGACTNCGAQLTPMRPHLTLHFQKLLQQKNASKGTKARKRVQSQYYGEALTSDEVMERMQEEKSTKGPSKKKRRQSPPEVEGIASSSRAANESEVESHDEGIYVYHFNERHT